MSRRKFLFDVFKIFALSPLLSSTANAFGLFTTSFWKKRSVAAPWLTAAGTRNWAGNGGVPDSAIGPGARICRMGNNYIGMIGGIPGVSSGSVAVYGSGAANDSFVSGEVLTGSFDPPVANNDSLGDYLEIDCVASTTSNQFYFIWQTGNQSYGTHAIKMAYNAYSATYSAYQIGLTYASTGPILGVVNSSDYLLIAFTDPNIKWHLRNASLGVVATSATSASIPTTCKPMCGFAIGTDFFVVCSRQSYSELVIVKINSSGAYVTHFTHSASASTIPATGTRGEAIVISSTSVAIVWKSTTHLGIFANFNPSTMTFTTAPLDLGFSAQALDAIVAAKTSTNEIVVNFGKYFKKVDTAGAMLRPIIQIASVRGGSGGLVFRSDDSRLLLVESINQASEKSLLFSREFIVT